ncbi:MAG: DEAD/DEAH box helicase [Bacteroidaceae bacterium]|nr:DEAD/DEAH box helicase [Bacteroidaceae bacterium]
MIFDRYEQLSEDAQRLLCFFVDVGLDSGKRMDEHFYMLSQYCFAAFDGMSALDELLREGILYYEGKDWYANMPRYGVSDADFVPSLWYLYECRKDLQLSFQKLRQKGSAYQAVRHSVRQLVGSGYQMCDSASVIEKEQVSLFYSVACDPHFVRLFENFRTESFVQFFENVCNHFLSCDMVVDTTLLLGVVERYDAIAESSRCRLIAEIELYEYIASGKMPANGIYDKMSAGYALFALRGLYEGRYVDAAKWFDISLKASAKEHGGQVFFGTPLLNFYMVLSFVAAMNESKDSNEAVVSVCRAKLREFMANLEVRSDERMLPARILAEDSCKVNTVMHKELVQKMYDESMRRTLPPVFLPLAFLLANHLGYSTVKMDVALCMPRLALLRHEMTQCLPFHDDERELLRRSFGSQPVLANIYHEAEWESVLESLMTDIEGKENRVNEEVRLMYLRESADSKTIQVREQTRLKNGNWGCGKRVNESRYRKGLLECMNNADRRILARLNHSGMSALQLEHVIEDMVEESRLYIGHSAPYELVQVNRDKPYLMIENEGGCFVVKSNVPVGRVKDDFVIVEESPTLYSVISIPNEIRGYYVKLLQLGTLPLEAEPTLRSLLAKIGGQVELHSSLIEGGSTLPIVEGQWTAGFKLKPKNSGNWNVECFVRPLPGGRRTCRLGEGSDVIIDENEEVGRVRVKRSLVMEQTNLQLIRDFWSSWGYELGEDDVYPPEFILQLVQLIQAHPDTFYAEWPEGRALRVKTLARGASSWSGVLRERGHWFDIEGDVFIDEHTRISISQLLELVGKSDGKFVQIADDEFLLLSEKLQQQLKALDAIASREHGHIKISPFSAALMGDEWLHGELELTVDEKLSDIRQRILQSSAYSPAVPSELNATLRPYQEDGYRWIARLNSWGAGALLADDMGLGKTIQTIAFLLLKKENGPSLIVAPASVVPNWKTEMERFAPMLRVHILNYAANRRQTIDQATAGDVIVATYGILLSVQDLITQKSWNVACLDEAHIIKNRGAKTSAAAMKIQACNRVMLTGTPVQNHLGELWSLFQFVNPGLLGTYEHFSRKFIIPIENHHDRDRQQQLDQIVHPFMLRRTKQAVLNELPDKTEIYHSVQLSREELAIYESIRIRTEKMLRESGNTLSVNVLAEITRLRQAACTPQLIEPKWTGDSSKVTALLELLQGVIEGGNRALVFSQFVSFFDIVRSQLDHIGIPYYYIDGSVPMRQRTEMVDAFQEGKRPLFLISLKAGGLGLNLTAANYVIHLDPWWNPAIEQQATDRAYRIGQHQAVTVYHLVSKNTIEEKIIRLHQTKRALADTLLAGTDISHRLTGEELLEMVTS